MKKRNRLFLRFLIFLITFVASFFLSFSVLRWIQTFAEIPPTVFFWIAVGISVMLSIINVAFSNRKARSIGINRISFWENKNQAKLILGYILIILFFATVTNTETWTSSEKKDFLSLQWTIFGLSIAMFVVWIVLVDKNFQKSKPTIADPKAMDYEEKYKYFEKRLEYYKNIDESFTTEVLLTINLFLLLLSSSTVYFSNKLGIDFSQYFLCGSFYFTTNTIITIFFGILTPFHKEHAAMKEDAQVTIKELASAQIGYYTQSLINETIENIENFPNLSDITKKTFIISYAEKMTEALLELADRYSNKDRIHDEGIPRASLDPDWIEDYS